MAVGDALIVVEGPHDAEFLARLLKCAGYERVTQRADLPEEWQRLVNPSFPKPGRGINQPHEVPQFRKLPTGELVSIAIAGGDSKLISSLEAGSIALGRLPGSIGFVLDDDRVPDPTTRYSALLHELQPRLANSPLAGLAFPATPGVVRIGPPRTGTFVLPDNQSPGTLEDVLLEAANISYGMMLNQAAHFVQNLDETGLTAEDLRERRKPAGIKKEIVSACASILKPGRALATSLQDNRWLDPPSLGAPLVRRFRVWLHEMLDLPFPA